MKRFSCLPLVSLCLLETACVSAPTSSDMPKPSAVEYCDGELWGYVVPVERSETRSTTRNTSSDNDPQLAAFLQMHSDLEDDPANSLTFTLALRTKKSLTIQIPEQVVKVRIDDADVKKIKMSFSAVAEAKSAAELYPYPKYEAQLVDFDSNKWRIAKLDNWFHLMKDAPTEITLPHSTVQTVSSTPLQITADGGRFKEISVVSSVNIWPKREPLQRSTIEIEIPKMIINGVTHEPRLFTFDMYYEDVKSRRALGSRKPCPSTLAVFHPNSF